MADNYGLFWNSIDGDRKYDADSFSEWLNHFFTSGVFTNELQVTDAGGMNLHVATGYANCEGKVRFFNAVTNLTLAVADATYPRIDTVVVEKNSTDRQITIKAVTGTPSNNPAAPAPERANGIFQLVLAQISIKAGATAVTASDITDTRANTDICGYVTGTVKNIDVSIVTRQLTSQFNDWFDHIKGQLTEDEAAHLEQEFEALQTQVNAIKTDSVLLNSSANASGSGQIQFAKDASGNYGYIKEGADSVTPFRNPTGNASPADVLSGKKFSSAALEDATGTMVNHDSITDAKSWVRGSSDTFVRIPEGAYLTDASSGFPEAKIQGFLYSKSEYDTNYNSGFSAGRTQGQNDVKNSPNSYSLYTKAQYDANYNSGKSAGANAIKSNASIAAFVTKIAGYGWYAGSSNNNYIRCDFKDGSGYSMSRLFYIGVSGNYRIIKHSNSQNVIEHHNAGDTIRDDGDGQWTIVIYLDS